jgi:Ankyrin repeats (3 copies)
MLSVVNIPTESPGDRAASVNAVLAQEALIMTENLFRMLNIPTINVEVGGNANPHVDLTTNGNSTVNTPLGTFSNSVPVVDGESGDDEMDPEEELDALMESLAESNYEDMRTRLRTYPRVVHIRCSDGTTALHHATARSDVEAVEMLLGAGASTRVRTQFGKTPLHLACLSRNTVIANKLILAGAQVDATDSVSESCLHSAVRLNDVAMVYTLMCHSASVDTPNLLGETALHLAARASPAAISTLLLQASQDLDKVDCQGNTPLHVSVIHNNVEFTRRYARNNNSMSRYARNLAGQSPMDLAFASPNVLLHNIFSEMQQVEMDEMNSDGGDDDDVNVY